MEDLVESNDRSHYFCHQICVCVCRTQIKTEMEIKVFKTLVIWIGSSCNNIFL